MMASNAVQLHHHHQVMTTHTLEEALPCAKQQPEQQQHQERRARPQPEQALRCPRCDSTNTKFCYYNNYSLSQPRYFCKGCRRYWTQGGTLRNVPVGGGCRKNKRSSSTAAAAAFKRFHEHPTPTPAAAAPTTAASPLPFDPADLALAFTRHDPFLAPLQASSSFLDVLRTGFLENAYGGFGYDLWPFQVGDHATPAAMAAGDAGVKQEPCLQWKQDDDGGLFLDYWGAGAIGGGGTAAAMSPWHGLVNSSLI